eukprot:Hpha_TRINITY_DN10208_c0_g1::TRINITY_DN10208_c0_g1_i1::g.35195::m.35195
MTAEGTGEGCVAVVWTTTFICSPSLAPPIRGMGPTVLVDNNTTTLVDCPKDGRLVGAAAGIAYDPIKGTCETDGGKLGGLSNFSIVVGKDTNIMLVAPASPGCGGSVA